MTNENDDARQDDRPDRRRFVGGAASLLALTLPQGAIAQTAGNVGAVEDLRGQAFAEKDKVRRELNRAAPVFVNDQIDTGSWSRLTMRLGRDTILKLGESARLVIDRYIVERGGEINLGAGTMLYERPDGSPPVPVRIRSAFGLIAVRGTRFFAGPSNDVFGVFVERGVVTVSAASKTVTVRTGQGTNIAYPGAAPTTPAAWGAPRIQAALASVQ
jgi:hypothetical protein